MTCVRGCVGTPICQATDICCMQYQQNCGLGCTDLPSGYSRLQFDAAGQLEICSNVSGSCSCVPFISSDSFSIVRYASGSPDVTVPDTTLVTLPLDIIERDPRSEWTILAGPTARWTALNTGNYKIFGSVHINANFTIASIIQSIILGYTVNTVTPVREVIAGTQRLSDVSALGTGLWLTRGATWERFNAGDFLDFTLLHSGSGVSQDVTGIGNETFIKIIQVG